MRRVKEHSNSREHLSGMITHGGDRVRTLRN
jgi:hypothetical protein